MGGIVIFRFVFNFVCYYFSFSFPASQRFWGPLARIPSLWITTMPNAFAIAALPLILVFEPSSLPLSQISLFEFFPPSLPTLPLSTQTRSGLEQWNKIGFRAKNVEHFFCLALSCCYCLYQAIQSQLLFIILNILVYGLTEFTPGLILFLLKTDWLAVES